MSFATNVFQFTNVLGGTLLHYTFIVSNSGDQTLVISKVIPGCHCTTIGNWNAAHQIEPGQTGEIPIQFDTKGQRGTVNRRIQVISNDKTAPPSPLSISGTVRQAIKVSPDVVLMKLSPNSTTNAPARIHISNQMDDTVTLSDPVSDNPQFTPEMKTLTAGREYELTVTAAPLIPGRYQGAITVNTSFTNIPPIRVRVVATVQATINGPHP